MRDPRNTPVIEVRVVDPALDGGQTIRTWTLPDVEAHGSPELDEIPEWAVDPRKTWQHPQDPIVYSMRVAPGRLDDAKAWLAALTPASSTKLSPEDES